MTLLFRLRPVLLGLLGVCAVVGVWHVLVATATLSPMSVPRPAMAGRRMLDLLTDTSFLLALWDTLRTWAWALALGGAIAIPMGLLIGHLRMLRAPTGFVVHAGRSIPSTALIPIAILLFGLGSSMKAAVVVYAVVWPMFLNSMYGAESVDPMMKTVAQSLHFSRGRFVRYVLLPSAAPAVATGIRVSAAIGLIVVFSAELLGATSGVGTVIVLYQQADPPRTDFVYAGIVVVGLVGLALSLALSALERRLLPWASSER